MDFGDIQNAMKFLNWEMVVAIMILTMGWTQMLKKWLPAEWAIGKAKVPIIELVGLASSMVLAHFIFDISGTTHTETVAIFHGFSGWLFATLGYEVIKGTKFGLRSSDEIKPPTGGGDK